MLIYPQTGMAYLEQQANNQHQALTEDLVIDINYLDEKISR